MQARLVKEQNELAGQYTPIHLEITLSSLNNLLSGLSPSQDHKPHPLKEDNSKSSSNSITSLSKDPLLVSEPRFSILTLLTKDRFVPKCYKRLINGLPQKS